MSSALKTQKPKSKKKEENRGQDTERDASRHRFSWGKKREQICAYLEKRREFHIASIFPRKMPLALPFIRNCSSVFPPVIKKKKKTRSLNIV